VTGRSSTNDHLPAGSSLLSDLSDPSLDRDRSTDRARGVASWLAGNGFYQGWLHLPNCLFALHHALHCIIDRIASHRAPPFSFSIRTDSIRLDPIHVRPCESGIHSLLRRFRRSGSRVLLDDSKAERVVESMALFSTPLSLALALALALSTSSTSLEPHASLRSPLLRLKLPGPGKLPASELPGVSIRWRVSRRHCFGSTHSARCLLRFVVESMPVVFDILYVPDLSNIIDAMP